MSNQVMDAFPEAYWRIKLAVLLVAERMKGPESFWCVRMTLTGGWMDGWMEWWMDNPPPPNSSPPNPNDRWPYLRNLPEKYAYMPIFYNNSEFGSIQIPSLMRTVQVSH